MERVSLRRQKNHAPFSLSQHLSGQKKAQPWLVCCCGQAAQVEEPCLWGSVSFRILSSYCSSVSRQQHCRQSGNQMPHPLVLQRITYKMEARNFGLCNGLCAPFCCHSKQWVSLRMACSKWWTCCARLALNLMHTCCLLGVGFSASLGPGTSRTSEAVPVLHLDKAVRCVLGGGGADTCGFLRCASHKCGKRKWQRSGARKNCRRNMGKLMRGSRKR